MGVALKDSFDIAFFNRLSEDIKHIISSFDAKTFIAAVIDEVWHQRTYKQRISHIAYHLRQYLPANYPQAIEDIFTLLEIIKHRLPDTSEIDDKHFNLLTLEYGAVLDSYIEQFGLCDLDTSIKAIERITQFTSCEFCIRAFILRYPEVMMPQMLRWAKHPHWAVRRLASEGCRPRLPWGVSLPMLKQNPTPILPILECLKEDASHFVRLSVANNLNDIAKDNPEVVIALVQKWKGISPLVDTVIKHGCRTLLKQGNTTVLQYFGLNHTHCSITALRIHTPRLRVGETLDFSFSVTNSHTEPIKIRLEYALYYQKKNGTLSKKIYKISEKSYPPYATTTIIRQHAMHLVSVRTLYPGLHRLSIIANGQATEKVDFQLTL